MHSPILFPIFGFVVGLAITFRMQSSYNRWWDGRTQWDILSAHSRNFARTVWLHVPIQKDPDRIPLEKKAAIRGVLTLAIALKHHLRGERDWSECRDLKTLVGYLPHVISPSIPKGFKRLSANDCVL